MVCKCIHVSIHTRMHACIACKHVLRISLSLSLLFFSLGVCGCVRVSVCLVAMWLCVGMFACACVCVCGDLSLFPSPSPPLCRKCAGVGLLGIFHHCAVKDFGVYTSCRDMVVVFGGKFGSLGVALQFLLITCAACFLWDFFLVSGLGLFPLVVAYV